MNTLEALKYIMCELDYLTDSGASGSREAEADKIAIIALQEKISRENAGTDKREEPTE